jgi:DNA-binding transcriptional regulator YbjK
MDAVTAATTPKGERRRAALVAAAGDLLVEGGFDAVRHRSVAARARIPLAATTYYFESLDDLLSHAVEYAGSTDLDRIRQRAAAVPRRRRAAPAIAELIGTVFFPSDSAADSSALVSRYERLVVCTRDPRLAGLQRELRGGLAEVHVEVLERSGRLVDPIRVQRLMAVEDGAALAAFTVPGTVVGKAVRDALVDVLDTLAPPLP